MKIMKKIKEMVIIENKASKPVVNSFNKFNLNDKGKHIDRMLVSCVYSARV